MEYKIVFKNGKELYVNKLVAEAINKAIISPDGCKAFQSFSDAANNNELVHIVNIADISFVTKA
jgi:hypothetical protein